ncbi:hypothetical protein [Ochrobactrum sp. BTU1]|uniref:hypothetical protein n=1 Tax=Ochrobactrum sp. BTU1 TaxID=2840456 RepID=UPI001C05C39B|nr:hypothetical protein KMS41_20090 [Ochrobactrum sp. BTU1]
MTSTTLCLRIEFMQKQVVELCKRAETIEQVNEVFKIASELIELTNRFDAMSFALYEMVLERRTELQKQQRRVEAASGKHNPQRVARKRILAAAGALPPHISCIFTEGEQAVLYIIVSDIQKTGKCCRTNKEIGDLAGVGLTTARNALRRARAHGLITIEHREQGRGKNLSNIIRLVCTG